MGLNQTTSALNDRFCFHLIRKVVNDHCGNLGGTDKGKEIKASSPSPGRRPLGLSSVCASAPSTLKKALEGVRVVAPRLSLATELLCRYKLFSTAERLLSVRSRGQPRLLHLPGSGIFRLFQVFWSEVEFVFLRRAQALSASPIDLGHTGPQPHLQTPGQGPADGARLSWQPWGGWPGWGPGGGPGLGAHRALRPREHSRSQPRGRFERA